MSASPARGRSATLLAVTCLAAIASASALRAQQARNSPHAGYVYPAGGRQNSTVRVRVGGQFLEGTTRAIVSGRGVAAGIVSYDRPLMGQPLTDLRDKAQELQKNAADPAVQKQIADIRLRIGDAQRRTANLPTSEWVTLEVNISGDAEPGLHQLRLLTPLGLSNPVNVSVGQLPEFIERDEKRSKADTTLDITLPATVNGRLVPGDIDRLRFPVRQLPQYMPGDVDRYRFHADKGQHLVVTASARELTPYLADAVPGWMQATVALLDEAGHELAYNDDHEFRPDPVLHYQVPRDGQYLVQIKDAIDRGRDDFVYRMSIGALPFVTSAFPLGGPAGARTRVTLGGWNLPSTSLDVDATELTPAVYSLQDHITFAVDTLPESVEREPNGSSKQAQAITLPVIVNGRIQEPGDRDVFQFGGRKGQQVVAEVMARRLDSPLDSVLELTDARGARIAMNDDYVDKAFGLITHHADSFVMATLPATGTYLLRLGDVQRKGGEAYAYRLRVSEPRPDFDLRLAPSSISAGGGAAVPIWVLAVRRDGFAGDISLVLKGAPAGYMLSGGTIPSGQDQVRMTLTLPPAATIEPISLHVEGRASIDGTTVMRPAVPADDMTQAFAYHQFVVADDLRVSVNGRGGARAPSRIVSALPVRIAGGSSAQVRVALPPAYMTFEHLELNLSDPPAGLTLTDVTVAATGAEFTLRADASAKPDLRGNLIVTVSGERVPPAGAPQQQRRRVVIGVLPAIAFAITPR